MTDTTHHRTLVANGALLLDVRTQAEFREAHVPHALNVPVQELPGRLGELAPTTRPIVVYCRSGGSSAQAVISPNGVAPRGFAAPAPAGRLPGEGHRPDDGVVIG